MLILYLYLTEIVHIPNICELYYISEPSDMNFFGLNFRCFSISRNKFGSFRRIVGFTRILF